MSFNVFFTTNKKASESHILLQYAKCTFDLYRTVLTKQDPFSTHDIVFRFLSVLRKAFCDF